MARIGCPGVRSGHGFSNGSPYPTTSIGASTQISQWPGRAELLIVMPKKGAFFRAHVADDRTLSLLSPIGNNKRRGLLNLQPIVYSPATPQLSLPHILQLGLDKRASLLFIYFFIFFKLDSSPILYSPLSLLS